MTVAEAEKLSKGISKGGELRIGSGAQSLKAAIEENPQLKRAMYRATKRAKAARAKNPEVFAYGALIERLQETNVKNFNSESEMVNTLAEAEVAVEATFERWEAENNKKLGLWEKEVFLVQSLMHGNPSDPDRYLAIRKMFVKANSRV